MTNREYKERIIEALKSRNVFTQQPSPTEIRTRCPFCGDSKKRQDTGHMYLRINPNDNLEIVYNCFKCPAQGKLQPSDLELFGIDTPELMDGIATFIKTSDKVSSNTSVERKERYFDYKLPPIVYNEKIKYIENRLGYSFSEEELMDMKVITSFREFLLYNKIDTLTCKPNFARMLDRQYVGFLSNNNSHILFRDITDRSDISWFKYPITEDSRLQKAFYAISSEIDLFTKEEIEINLSEGVMDILSIGYNLNHKKENALNIAVCGKYYNSMIKRLLRMGMVGHNVTINIYADNDHTEDTSIGFYRKTLQYFKNFVKEINVFYNVAYKDCGVRKEKIKLEKYKI